MTSKRTILTEATVVFAVLATGISAAEAARATPLAVAAQASNSVDPRANVKIQSTAQVERLEQNASGNSAVKLYAPGDVKVVPGDKLIFVNAYRNEGSTPVTGFVVNNPLPSAVSFTSVAENWALVSIDGGKTFGKLVDMTVTKPISVSQDADVESSAPATNVTRAAQPSDVTHIRWQFTTPIAAGGSGKLSFRGIVK